MFLCAAVFALAAGLAAGEALALDDMEEMLVRARSGTAPTARDRELARELLEEWHDSERTSAALGDPAVGRVLEAISSGRSLSGAEAEAAARMEESYRRSRAEEAGGDAFAAQPVGPAGPAALAARPWSLWTDGDALWVVLTAGAGVVAIGAAWIAAWRVLRRRST